MRKIVKDLADIHCSSLCVEVGDDAFQYADALREFVDAWEAEQGPLTVEELRRAEAELGLRIGEPAA